jgi:DNA-binding NarL/FixJ family response regulator
VGEAAASRDTVALCQRLAPGVLVLDAAMPDLDGVPTIVAVHSVSPGTSILAVADSAEARCPVLRLRDHGDDRPGGRPCDPATDCLQLAVARGALGAIRASAEPSDLFRAVRAVASGTAWYEAGTASRLLARALATAGGSSARALSARDVEVASLVAEGRCNKEIARALGIGEPSVKRHVSRVLHRLELADRVQLALYLVRHPQVLEPPAPMR